MGATMQPDPNLVLEEKTLQRKKEFRFVSKPVVTVRCGDAGGSINEPFVKDQSVLFVSLNQANFLGRLVTIKEIGCYNVNVCALILWVIQFFQNVLFHGLVIQFLQRSITLHSVLPLRVR